VTPINPCILVFIKAPYPGQVKTRLGKFIGNTEATQLYQYFVEDVLATIDALGVKSLIFFSPTNSLSMLQSWLGFHRTYIPQQGDSLGDRMAHAFRTSFTLDYQQVLIVGSDSPDLPSAYLLEALDALQQDKTVIGPSEDGGYYTLGFTPNTFCPDVFQDIPWSTSQVYLLTIEKLKHNALSIQILPTWSDIDTLDDLWKFHNRHLSEQPLGQSLSYLRDRANVFFPHLVEAQCLAPLQNVSDSTKNPEPDLSIIIPVLYEAERIRTCLENLLQLAGDINLEVIVVDGDPKGTTLSHVPSQYPYALKGIQSPKGRGTQMNAGAQIAQGQVLLFLHADTDLPDRALLDILHTCKQYTGGAFDLAIASPRRSLKLVGKVASWRSRLTRIPYGDQAIFMRKDIFEQVQGYPDIPLMEDVALMQRLKQHGYPIHILSQTVKVSARRWEKEGIVRCTLRNWSLILLYSLGIHPETLACWYRPTPNSTPQLIQASEKIQ
jgi:uncharacterized protein